MNLYRVIIVSALFGTYFIELISQWLNLKSMRMNLPPEFQGLYDDEKYRKSQEYTRARTALQLLEATTSLVCLFVFWFAEGFYSLDEFVRRFQWNPVLTGLLYIGILALASGILALPFSIYSTFVIEEKFGFNRTTALTFVMDRLKALLLSIALGGPLLALVLWFFGSLGPNAWFFCWLVCCVVILLIQFVAPIWLFPLFNKYTPLPDGELKDAIRDYAGRIGFLFQDILIMDGSRRSSKANAFFTGFGKYKRIALFDTLVEQHSVPELVAVLAHEIGHYKKKHVVRMMLLSFFHLGLLFFLLSLFIHSRLLAEAFFLKDISTYTGIVFFGLVYEPVSFLWSLLIHVLSRRDEFEADRFARETIEDPELMVRSLKKLSVRNLSNLTPHPFYVFLHYSHPPLRERIEAIRQA